MTANESEIRTMVVESIAKVAPDVAEEIPTVDPSIDLWDALGLDSMDHLNVMTELWERTGTEIAERDYGRLRSVDAIVEYLVAAG
jgi:acyl carrier protein